MMTAGSVAARRLGSSTLGLIARRSVLRAAAAGTMPPSPSPSLSARQAVPALARRELHAGVCACKSRRSRVESVDDAAYAEDDGGADVPVMRTKGKGKGKAAASSSSGSGGAKSKRGAKEAEQRADASRYATSTRNQELPDERFDSEALEDNMKRAVERCRQTVKQKVGMLGRVDPSVYTCEREHTAG